MSSSSSLVDPESDISQSWRTGVSSEGPILVMEVLADAGAESDEEAAAIADGADAKEDPALGG
jgi:hypothetical protein